MANESEALSFPDDASSGTGGCFRLRKWYFDFLTTDFDFCFVYFAEVRFLGSTFRSLTIHLARPSTGVRITKSLPVHDAVELFDESRGRTISFSGGRITLCGSLGAIDAHFCHCAVHLRYAPLNGSNLRPVVICSGGRSQILWRPLSVRARVLGSVAVCGNVIDVQECNGYIDYLESSYLPPAVPVRTLRWGRLHHPDLDLVFMRAADGRGNAAGSRLSCYAGTSVTHYDDVLIVNTPSPHGPTSDERHLSGYSANTARGSRRVQIKVRHADAVQEGGFIDHREVKSAAVRYVLKKLTRDPRSTKWLSFADVMLEEGETTTRLYDVPLIDEFAFL